MTISLYFLLFITYSTFGWLLEVILTYNLKEGFVNRGFLIGPYCPIHGVCALAMILLLNNIESYFILFFLAFLLCSIIEYITSFIMEKMFKARWWDYSHLPLNINGRICLLSSAFFGILGLLLIKYINPFVLGYILVIPTNYVNILALIILVIFMIDNILSYKIILKVKDTAKFVIADNTREITSRIKKIINDNFLEKRLFLAFPNVKFSIKDIRRKFRGN
ncbi:MAG: putative ABC transporter permease [Bacilli bacterium]|nr:putative ABC transporter permease [Bacilli bacterium]